MARQTPSHELMLLVLKVIISLTNNNKLDSLSGRINFYPSALVISHNSKPLAFYDDTKLIHISIPLKIPRFSKPAMSNNSCSRLDTKFFDKLLKSMSKIENTAKRLLSLPGFSTLIECDTYLSRYFYYQTGQPSKMFCAKAYRDSLAKCKQWALSNCKRITMEEMLWLKAKNRHPRSNWACSAGVFG